MKTLAGALRLMISGDGANLARPVEVEASGEASSRPARKRLNHVVEAPSACGACWAPSEGTLLNGGDFPPRFPPRSPPGTGFPQFSPNFSDP